MYVLFIIVGWMDAKEVTLRPQDNLSNLKQVKGQVSACIFSSFKMQVQIATAKCQMV